MYAFEKILENTFVFFTVSTIHSLIFINACIRTLFTWHNLYLEQNAMF